MHFTKGVIERFESFYQKGTTDDCWEWKGSKASKGYGTFSMRKSGVERKTFSAHRLAWSIANNCDIPEGKMICHHCDKPSCVNPTHLYMGTGFDNNLDTVKRGRATRKTGVQCSWAKLTDKDILEIRSSSERQYILAVRYGVSQSHISRIKTGDRNLWACVGKA